jgi:hypothetical protein
VALREGPSPRPPSPRAGSLPGVTEDQQHGRRRLPLWLYWLIVLAIAVGLGVLAPAFFLLGFWEMIPLVLLATWLAPKVAR